LENLDGEVDINSAWENIKISAQKKSRLLWTEEAQAMVWWRMFKTIRSKETI
jgi:hypothetical protein